MSRRNRSQKIGMAQRGSIALMFGTFTVLFLYLAAVVPPKFALPLLGIAGLFVAGVMAEQEIGKAILMFCCCCVAAMILIPNFQAYAPYIAFFGWYGIAKFPLDEMKDKLTKWILKLILFNVGMADVYKRQIKERTIVINGVSKTYAMTGWRIGYLACEERLAKVIANWQSHATSNPNSIAQAAAQAAIEGDQSCVCEMVKEFGRRREEMIRRIDKMPGVSCVASKGEMCIRDSLSDLAV